MRSFVQAVGMNSSREDCPQRWKRKNPRISVSRVVVCSEWMNGSAVAADSPMAKRRGRISLLHRRRFRRGGCRALSCCGSLTVSSSFLMSATNFHTLVEALLQAPSFRPFITMWHNEDNVQRVSFGELIYLAKLQSAEFH